MANGLYFNALVCCNISMLCKRKGAHSFNCWWNRSGVSLLCNTTLDAKGVATYVLSMCVCVGLCLFSSPCDPFADRPQCSPLCRGFHANAASGKTKDEDSLGLDQRDHCFSLLLLLSSMFWKWQRYYCIHRDIKRETIEQQWFSTFFHQM